AAAVKRSRTVADRMAKGVEFLFRKNKITLFPGRGRLVSPTAVEVAGATGTERLEARAVIIATGSTPKSLPGVTIDEVKVISSNGAVRNETRLRSIIVIGAGAVDVWEGPLRVGRRRGPATPGAQGDGGGRGRRGSDCRP